jgi:hypothetical protein
MHAKPSTRKWLFLLVTIIMIMLPLAAVGNRVSAQGGGGDYNFTASNGGWIDGAFNDGSFTYNATYDSAGWHSAQHGADGRVLVNIQKTGQTNVDSVTVYYTCSVSPDCSFRSEHDGWIMGCPTSGPSCGPFGSGDTTIGAGGILLTGDHNFTYSFSSPYSGVIGVQLNVSEYSGVSGSISITRIVLNFAGGSTPTPTPSPAPDVNWVYPIAQPDRDGYLGTPVYDIKADLQSLDRSEDSNATVVLGGTQNAHVHSMVAGTVTEVLPVSTCVDTRSTSTNVYWQLVPYDRNTPPRCYLRSTDYSFESAISLGALYKITVSIDGDRLVKYIVKSPLVQAGQTVSKGCILGTTVDWYTNGFKTGNVLGQMVLGGGLTIVQAIDTTDDSIVDIPPLLLGEPLNLLCGRTANSQTCKLVTNPTFTNSLYGWTVEEDPFNHLTPSTDTSGGLSLKGKIRQDLNLDPAQEYKITVIYHANEPSTVNFQLQLGTEDAQNITHAFVGSETQTTVIPAQTYTANNTDGTGNYYTLSLSDMNGGSTSPVIIDFICVSNPADDLPVDTSGCIFVNSEFDSNSDWTLSGAVISQGYALASDGDTLSETITLNRKGDGSAQPYLITALARASTTLDSGDSFTLSYTFGSSSGDLAPDISSAIEMTESSHTFNISTSATDTFTVSVAGPASKSVIIDSLCITSGDGDPVPGYTPRPISGVCKVCIYAPVGDLVVDTPNLFGWFWCSLRQLWDCQAKTILYGIWTALVNILTLLGFLRLWLAGTFTSFSVWSNNNLLIFARWLNGVITNAVAGLGAKPTSSTNLWDALIAVVNAFRDVILRLLDDIMTLVMAVVGVVINAISFTAMILLSVLTSVLGIVPQILSAIVTAFNTTAATLPPGAPTCSDPTSLTYYPCLGFYILDNTIFSGPIQWLIPLGMGALAFERLIWALEQISEAFHA